MIIAVTASGAVELRDPDNFRAFKIVDEMGKGPERLSTALAGLARTEPDGKSAWVQTSGIARLLPAPPTPGWQAAFDGMLAFARKHGWVDDAAGTVRAHVETSVENRGD